MSDVISDVTRFRALLGGVVRQLEHTRDVLREETECDCPPEWARCASCQARLRLLTIQRNIEAELKKVNL
jgi:hypothetical protein